MKMLFVFIDIKKIIPNTKFTYEDFHIYLIGMACSFFAVKVIIVIIVRSGKGFYVDFWK